MDDSDKRPIESGPCVVPLSHTLDFGESYKLHRGLKVVCLEQFYNAVSPEEVAREAYIKKSITETLGLALKTLQHKHVNSEEPIYSEDSANTVCNILEAVFLHGLKASFSRKLSSYLIGVDQSKVRQPSYWELLTRFSHKDVVSQLNHLGQITTEIGMCRAWLRVALNDGLLESYLDAMLADKGTLRYFYKRTAYLRDEEQAGILKSYSQGIQNFRFQLSYNSSVLNIWTTTPLVLAGIVEQTMTPRAAMSTSVSESALSEISPASSAEETKDEVAPGVRRRGRHKKTEPVIVSSRSYTGDLRAAAASPPTPPNTPYNASSLSTTEIEEIRKFTEQSRGTGSPSTPTSQISFPDYAVEGRFLSSPEPSSDHVRSSSRSPTTGRSRSRNRGAASVDMSIEEEAVSEQWEAQQADESLTAAAASGQIQGQSRGQVHGQYQVQEHVTEEIIDIYNPTPSVDRAGGQGAEGGEGRTLSEMDTVSTNVQVSEQSSSSIPTQTETSESSPPTASVSLIKPPLRLQQRKTAVLEPVLSDVTVRVEVAREMSPTMVLGSTSGSDPDENQAQGESQPYGIYDEYAPSPQGNKLGSMQGWSSEFQEPEVPFGQVNEERPAEVSLHRELSLTGSTQESYNALLQNYTPGQVNTPNMTQVLENLSPTDDAIIPPQHALQSEPAMTEEYDYPEDYDVLPLGLNVTSEQADARTQQLVALVGQICNEKGLDQQNYQCNGCSRPIGMIYGKARDCAYDGCYYCYECHENDESIIPSRIVHNWDFSKHKVACHTMRFLKQIEEDPLLNIQHINPRLYEHVPEMKELKEARVQLRFLKAYLFTCKQSVADDLRKQVWPREYLYDDIHLYSVQDLLQIQNGQLLAALRKVIKFASKHVYDCRLCCQKGFICEVCNNPKVIYPFQAETTWRCEQCNAVYHKECKRTSSQCLKCKRRRQRKMSLGDIGESDSVDYAYVPQ